MPFSYYPQTYQFWARLRPTTLTTAYSAGQSISGLESFTFPDYTGPIVNIPRKSVIIREIWLEDISAQNDAKTIYLMRAAPTVTPVAGVAWTPSAQDTANGSVLRTINMAAGTAGANLSVQYVSPALPIRVYVLPANGIFYVVITTSGTPTYGAANTIGVDILGQFLD